MITQPKYVFLLNVYFIFDVGLLASNAGLPLIFVEIKTHDTVDGAWGYFCESYIVLEKVNFGALKVVKLDVNWMLLVQ